MAINASVMAEATAKGARHRMRAMPARQFAVSHTLNRTVPR